MNIDKLHAVLDYCSSSYDKPAVKTGSRTAVAVTGDLLAVARSLSKDLGIDDKSSLKVTVSYGSGYFPKCLWVGLAPKGRSVSSSMSVCLCIAPRGEGVVVGSMFPQARVTGQYQTIRRSTDPNLKVRLKLPTAKRNYEDCFVNPLELVREELNEKKIVEHFRVSIKMLREYLDYVDSLTRK